LSSSSGPSNQKQTVAGSSGQLLIDQPASHVTRVTISHPRRRGALDHAILDELARLLPTLDARCLIITGEGASFSSGYDLGDLPDETLPQEAEKLIAHPFTAALEAIEDYPRPTVAAINGYALGGGLELALACDIRVAAAGVELGMPPAKLGLIYSHTGLQRFIETIGAPRTREMFFTARTIDAARAERWGLVNEVVEADQLEAISVAMAAEIAAHAPLSQVGNKRIIRSLMDARAKVDPKLEQALLELRQASFRSDDFREGVRSFREKRPPEWHGR
jgi:enoyl-CoA hydratase/carnithine racemase